METFNLPLGLAALLTFLTWIVHTFVGGPEVARPLLRSDLDPVVKLTHYYCWHMITLTLLGVSVAFLASAFVPAWRSAAVLAFGLSAAYALWSLLLMASRGRRVRELPQWILFALNAGFAAMGLWA